MDVNSIDADMVAGGYMYKLPIRQPDRFAGLGMSEIYSVSSCISPDFCNNWIEAWQHNGYWLFNSPEPMDNIAHGENIDLAPMTLFFYTLYCWQWRDDENHWQRFSADPAFETEVILPDACRLQGYDVVSFFAGNSAECSPLSCNGLAEQLTVNAHCLFDTLQQAKSAIENGDFDHSEPGPWRIFAVYSVER
jgi:hypothetical protein